MQGTSPDVVRRAIDANDPPEGRGFAGEIDGSLVARELDRLARQAGYKRRMHDHVTKYVRSRLD